MSAVTTKQENHPEWNHTKAAWAAERQRLLAEFRPRYFAEVQRFAEELRPAFEAGQVRGELEDDLEEKSEMKAGRVPWAWFSPAQRPQRTPSERLEELCGERFGLEVVDDEGDEETAHLVLAVSPAAKRDDDLHAPDWNHPCIPARICAARDVIAIARARGYYVPAPEERPRTEWTAWAREEMWA